MSVQGFWTATFKTPLGMGYGVAYFTNGHVFGGDSAFTYVGTYTEQSDALEAKLRISPYNNSMSGVFGGGSAFELTINGRIDGGRISGNGSASHYPGIPFAVTLAKA